MRLQLIHKLDNAHDDSIWSVAFQPGAGGLLARFPLLRRVPSVFERSVLY